MNEQRRVVVVETVYFAGGRGGGSSFETRFSRQVKNTQEPHVTVVELLEGWTPLSLGWVAEPSMVVLKNVGKLPVEARFAGDLCPWAVEPGESMRGKPKGQLEARGPGLLEVSAFPS